MKINFTLFAALAFFLGLAGCAEAQPGKITTFGEPMLTPDKMEHNYGQVKNDLMVIVLSNYRTRAIKILSSALVKVLADVQLQSVIPTQRLNLEKVKQSRFITILTEWDLLQKQLWLIGTTKKVNQRY